MKVTVKDCLELPSFQKAEVLAGENSLINRVEKVSVLDMFVPKDIRKHYTAPNQMVLTSFSAIRSDEDAQCKAIEALAAGGSVAIVVFHVGDIVRYLTEKVIAAAEKSGIPLIAMAAGNPADMGDVIGDISGRRGRIEGSDMQSGAVTVRGMVPLSEMFGYATDLRSKTQGRGVYVMQFDHFEELPENLIDKINK